jgi:hypothetical protein
MVYSEYSPEPESHPWWVYVLVVTVLIVGAPLWIALALFWWAFKAMGFAGAAAAVPWWPWHKRTPAQEQHGRRA